MPAINIGDFQIMVQTVQETQPSLKIMNHDGEIFYVGMSPGACPKALKISDGQNVYSLGSSNLYWQATSFNECESVELEPGCYRVELRGGAGGDGGNNADTGTDAVMQSYDFTITETVTAYILRGGDGSVNVSSSGIYSGGGGGGAVSTGGLFGTGVSVNGGAGGSGSSGTSDTSYVKIYRFG
ncbi:MAG: hypothetical protein R8N50_03870 [Alphaproteobacteria bacterium]|nr:hypothetical protein [Alphaproteobacteria bacterium]